MGSACPELEQLDEFVTDPDGPNAPVRDHVTRCTVCQARLAELSRNQALFVELSDAAMELGVQLSPPAPIPSQIGSFDIVREVGRGGMGVVYEADQRHPERRVALKVLRGDYTGSEERTRLLNREIRVLARLRHPGITAIYESGMTAGGPFYAMEFVEGATLTEYAGRHSLDLRQRLQLYLKLCAAISYAHQHGVIHRDLKPGNILVEETGTIKVLDFGLARITDPDVASGSLVMDTNRIVGTLAYMSPEQTRGESDDIDLRSDVYSLGVILFELLTGILPYEVSRTSMPAAVRSICESPPRRPRDGGDPSIDSRMLKGDLETILLKALEKSPDQRYQSVAALADDIERFLGNQTIVARSPNAIYQFRKFAQRNHVLVGGVVAVFVALTLGITATAWQAYRASNAEHAALDEAATNAEINRFLSRMFGSVNPAADGHDVRVVEILKRAAGELDHAFGDRPQVAMALRDTIGRAYQSLTLYPESEPQFRAGLELARALRGEQSRQFLEFRYHLAEALAHDNEVEQSLRELESTLAAQIRLFGPDDVDTLVTKNFLGVLKVDLNEYAAGEALLREAYEGRAKSLGPAHELTLAAMENLALCLGREGKQKESAVMLRQAHESALGAQGPDHAQTLVFASNVATLARTPAELEAVEPIYREIVERGARVFGPDHQQTLAFLGSLAMLLELRCKYAESEKFTRDLYERLKRARGEHDPQTVAMLGVLARRIGMSGRWVKAASLTREHLRLCRELYGASEPRTLDAMYNLTQALNSSGRPEEALQLADETLAAHLAGGSGTGADSALIRTVKADILRGMNRLPEARADAEKAVADLQAAHAEDILTAWAESNLASCLRDENRFADAEPLMRGAYERLVSALGECHPTCVDVRDRLLGLYRMWNETDPAGGHERQLAALAGQQPVGAPLRNRSK